jgi:membrane carboxypeptidase/penicillin-binding protein PbpC
MDDPIQHGARVLTKQTAWLISDILSDNTARLPEFGEQGPLTFSYPVAAKTGTTRNSRDNWTIGFTPTRIVGVWVGNIDNTPMKGTSGVTGAGPIFHQIMDLVMAHQPKVSFERPGDIRDISVCALTGLLPSPDCSLQIREWFKEGTEPSMQDDAFTHAAVDVRNGLLATDACPKRYIQIKRFVKLPPEVRAWGLSRGYVPPPVQTSPLCSTETTIGEGEQWIRITHPADGDSFLLDPLVPNANERIILTASAGTAVSHVEWLIDGRHVATATAPFFTASWQPQAGRHMIEARAGTVVQNVHVDVQPRR